MRHAFKARGLPLPRLYDPTAPWKTALNEGPLADVTSTTKSSRQPLRRPCLNDEGRPLPSKELFYRKWQGLENDFGIATLSRRGTDNGKSERCLYFVRSTFTLRALKHVLGRPHSSARGGRLFCRNRVAETFFDYRGSRTAALARQRFSVVNPSKR
jgi:hypothetical protein